jgi:WD40 repeat protein
MPRKLVLLLLLCLFCFSASYAQETSPELEVISSENAKWLVPLEIMGAGAVYDSFWMNDGATLGLRSAGGISLYETIEHDGLLEIAPEATHFYQGLERPVSSPGFQRWYAIEVITDSRPDTPNQFNVWDLQTGEVLSRIIGAESLVAISPDGETAAAKTEDTVEIYSLRTGQRISVIAVPAEPYGVSFSYDGRYLLAGGGTSGMDSWSNGYLMVFDLIAQQVVAQLDDQTSSVQSRLYFSPDGRFIGTGYLGFWEFDAENYQLRFLGEEPEEADIGFDFISHDIGERRYFVRKFTMPSGEAWQLNPNYLPDKAYFADMEDGYLATGIGDGEPIERAFPRVTSAVYRPDGQTLYYSSPVPLENHDSVLGLRLEARPYELGLQENAIFHENGHFFFSYDRETSSLKAFDLRSQEAFLDYSPVSDSNFAVAQNLESIAWLDWNSETRTGETKVLNMNTGEILSFEHLNDFSLSADGRYLRGRSDEDYDIKVFDILENTVQTSVLAGEDFSDGYVLSSDNRYIHPSLEYDFSQVYDAESGDVLRSLSLLPYVDSYISPSPDGKTIVLVDSRLVIWGVPVPPAEPTTVVCPNAPSPQLSAGTEAVVRAQELRLRSRPNGSIKASLLSGTVVSVERGPICANGLLWWGISNEELGLHGWAAEAISAEDFLLVPAN